MNTNGCPRCGSRFPLRDDRSFYEAATEQDQRRVDRWILTKPEITRLVADAPWLSLPNGEDEVA